MARATRIITLTALLALAAVAPLLVQGRVLRATRTDDSALTSITTDTDLQDGTALGRLAAPVTTALTPAPPELAAGSSPGQRSLLQSNGISQQAVLQPWTHIAQQLKGAQGAGIYG
ncbi:hypothetical protein HaLaN_13719 [Haematococcus lacustris]|uniref:Uncharacterized protein n=1 Tax=Haematococcus lacustris TaxID=44745 RepID=A0A699Z3H8_HAELA|nr:hypothetical protein HaLaN_13719 [Haematococcus lacustris]